MPKAKKKPAKRAAPAKASRVVAASTDADALQAGRVAAAAALTVGRIAHVVAGSRKGEIVTVERIVGGYVNVRAHDGSASQFDAYKLAPE